MEEYIYERWNRERKVENDVKERIYGTSLRDIPPETRMWKLPVEYIPRYAMPWLSTLS